jgi:hypothetical protein
MAEQAAQVQHHRSQVHLSLMQAAAVAVQAVVQVALAAQAAVVQVEAAQVQVA